MGLLRVLSIISVVAVSYAVTDFSAQVKDVQKDGDALPALLTRDWTLRLNEQKQNFTAAGQKLTQELTGDQKTAVTEALKELNEVVEKINSNLTAFKNSQNTDATTISKNYASLFNIPKSSEQAIQQLRTASQKTVKTWEPKLQQLHTDAHQTFESTVHSLAESISKKSKDTQQGDKVREAVTNVGVKLLEVLVKQQTADTAVLTKTQLGLYSKFFDKAQKVLLDRMEANKVTKGKGSNQ